MFGDVGQFIADLDVAPGVEADAVAAVPQQLGRLVVQGGLTTGLLHALVAMDMPGPGTVKFAVRLPLAAMFASFALASVKLR